MSIVKFSTPRFFIVPVLVLNKPAYATGPVILKFDITYPFPSNSPLKGRDSVPIGVHSIPPRSISFNSIYLAVRSEETFFNSSAVLIVIYG